jgi:DNA-formamidopyrimidine glycosylase
MPEIVEVCLSSLELHASLKGKELTNIVILKEDKTKGFSSDFKYFPCKLQSVSSKGKKIIFVFDKFLLGTTLGMEGHWGYSILNEFRHTKLYLEFGDIKLYYDDTRCFGTNVFIHTQEELNDFLKDVGIDLLRERHLVTQEKWNSEIKNPRIRNKSICDFLLEQKKFAGIGNYLRAEILYDAKINPFRTLENLSDSELVILRNSTFKIIDEAFRGKGLTIASYSTPNGAIGVFECKVYGKSEDPFGNPIMKSKTKGDRMIHYCPGVQN